MVIYLVLVLPLKSSNLPYRRLRAITFDPCLFCSEWGLHVTFSRLKVGSLLHCLSTLTNNGGLFLLHYPWSRLHWTLSSILLYGARTFLMPKHATIWFTHYKVYYTTKCIKILYYFYIISERREIFNYLNSFRIFL